MNSLRARVENGRLVLDEPTTLPDGTVVDLVLDDEGDELTETDRAALHAALTRSSESLNAGSTRFGDRRRVAHTTVSFPVITTPESR